MIEANMMKVPVEDIIFERRNKDYGAYDIRKKYNRNVGIATAIAISFLLLALFGPIIINKLMPEEVEPPVIDLKPTATTLGPPPDLTKVKPPPPPEQIIEPPKQIKFTEPKVVKEEVPDEPPPTQKEQQENNTGNTTVDGPVDAPPAPPVTPVEPVKPTVQENFEFAQELPKPKIDLQAFFNTHVKYPDLAQETGVQGTVFVKAVVKSDGSIDKSTITIGKGIKNGGAGLNDEALRVVRLIPDGSFSPGNNNGNPVNVWISIPVRFQVN
jgi:protein TonB